MIANSGSACSIIPATIYFQQSGGSVTVGSKWAGATNFDVPILALPLPSSLLSSQPLNLFLEGSFLQNETCSYVLLLWAWIRQMLYRGSSHSLIHSAKVLSRSFYFLSDFLDHLISNTLHQCPRLQPDRKPLLVLKSISLPGCGLINHIAWYTYRKSGLAFLTISMLVDVI